MFAEVNANKNYEPKQIETEFSAPIEKVMWMSKNIPKTNEQFLKGLDKSMQNDLKLKLLNNYGPYMVQ